MLKIVLISLLLCVAGGVRAQPSDSLRIQRVIEQLVAGIEQDSIALIAPLLDPDAEMRVIYNTMGETHIRLGSVERLMQRIQASNDTKVLDVEGLSIEVNGESASAWMMYRLYVNGELVRYGTADFVLKQEGQGWKIIYIVNAVIYGQWSVD